MSNTETVQSKTANPKAGDKLVAKGIRRRKKTEGRKKRVTKLKADKDFAKKYFEGKSKRAIDKKAAFRKKKSKKK